MSEPIDQKPIGEFRPKKARFHTLSDAGNAVISALPGIKCPACHHDQFVFADRIDEKLRTRINLYNDLAPLPKEAITTLSLVCNNCGFVCSFEERILHRLVEANEAGENAE